MKSKKKEEKEYNGSDIEYEQEEDKKFRITRGMLILAGIVLLFIIIIIILIKSLISKIPNDEKYTLADFNKLEQRMEEEAPIYIYQKNIELTEEKIKINLDDLLTTNGGSIDPSKNKVANICDGYVIAYNDGSDYYKAYIKCDDKYTTDGYEEPEKTTINSRKTSTTTKYKDNVKPDILIIGEKEITIYVGDNYVEPGFTATDNIDGDITSDVKVEGKVDTSKKGTYILTYKVKDKAGNSNEITRKVIVLERQTTTSQLITTRTTTVQRRTTTTTRRVTSSQTPNTTTAPQPRTSPTITLRGSRDITLYRGEKYSEPGYTAKDANGKDLTSRVVIQGEVNVNKPGVYTLKYYVVDDYGLSFTTSRIVVVKETTKIIYVTSITMSPNYLTLTLGETGELTININPVDATDKSYTCMSSDTSVAIVFKKNTSKCEVRGIKRGHAGITVKSSNGKTATTEVTVK